MNFFYRFYDMKLRPFALTEYSQGECGRHNVNLLTAPTNHRVVVDVKINCNSRGSSSETDIISREINEDIDINSLTSGARKKRKAIAKATRISSTSKDEGSSI